MTIEMKQVFSSNVEAVGYDADEAALYIQWKSGKTSKYDGVPPAVAQQAQTAHSIGQYVHANIKGQYGHQYV